MCTGGSKMLLDSTSGRCCNFFLPSSSACRTGQSLFVYGKSLLDCPFDTMNSKTSRSPAAVLEIQQQLSSLHNAVNGIFCSLCSSEEASCCHIIYSYSLHIALQLMATLSHYEAEHAFKFNFDESINSLHPSGLWLCRVITRSWTVLHSIQLPSTYSLYIMDVA